MRIVNASPFSLLRYTAEILVLGLLYYAGARMGLTLAFAQTNATPIWPPAGLALAAMILRGPRFWPAICLGAFGANLVTFLEHGAADPMTSMGVAGVIAVGNTLGAVAGWRICCCWLEKNEDGSLQMEGSDLFETMTVFRFVGAAVIAALVSALFGPVAVCVAKIGPWEWYPLIAFTWWSGDATGLLYVAPFVLSVAGILAEKFGAAAQDKRSGSWRRVLEPTAAFTFFITTCWMPFGMIKVREFPAPVVKLLPLVALTWIAVRFGVRATSFALMLLACVVVWTGRKFFGEVEGARDIERLLEWLGYLWIVGLMFLSMAAAVDGHKRALASLREAKVALDATMDAIPAMLVVAHDRDCHRVTGNAPAHEMLRIPAGANLSLTPPTGTNPGYEVRSGGRFQRNNELAMQKVAATGQPIFGQELELVFPDGDSCFVFGNVVPLLDERGASQGCVAAFVDVTQRRRAEEALGASQQQLADDLAAMRLMQQVSARLVGADDFETLLPDILDAAIAISHADMGNIQLLENGVLRIVVHRGFEAPFLEYFNGLHDGEGAWGTAMRHGARLIVDDVATSPVFANSPAREVMLAAGARAVQSTPLVSRSGRVLGMFSTHYYTQQRPGEQALRLLDVLARQAADLIERTQTERALRESEERFRTMADVAPVMIWMSGLDNFCTYFNEPWREFTGRTMEEEIGEGWAELLHPDDRGNCQRTRASSFRARTPFRMEYRLRRHDGEYRWLLDHGVPRFGSAGEFAGFIGSCMDITERKQVESDMAFLLGLSEQRRMASTANEVLAGAADKLAPHLGADSCWFATVDANGDTFTIRRMHLVHGVPLEGEFGMSSFGPDVVKMLRAGHFVVITDVARDPRTSGCSGGYIRLGIGAGAVVPLLRDGRLVALLALTTRGPRLWSQHEAAMLRNVAERMWLAMERLRLSAQLSESEARFRTMAEWVPVFIFTTGPAGILDYVNERFSEFTGLPLDRVAGQGWLQVVHPDDCAHVREQWQNSMRHGEPFSTSFRISDRDRSYRWFNAQAHPVRNDRGEIVRWFGSCADIDELMRSKSELQELNGSLEERVRERTAQLEAANRELEREFNERRRLEREMLDISEKERRVLGQDLHDGVCQHLSGLALMAETLAFKMREKGIMEESERLDGITKLIRSAAGQTRAVARGLHPVDVDANGLVAALKELATRHSTVDGVQCRLRCGRPVPLQDNNVALHLYRIAQEAVVNALKHAGAKEIVIDLRTTDNQIDLKVTDDGAGIPPGKKLNGGMGLHLMHYRAGVIGGTLSVRQSVAGGTVVACVLPITEAYASETATGPVPLLVRRQTLSGARVDGAVPGPAAFEGKNEP